MKTQNKQNGFLLIGAIILIIIIGLFAIGVSHITTTSLQASTESGSSSSAFNLAEAGLNNATGKLLGADPRERSTCADLASDIGTVSFGDGEFTVTGTVYYNSSPLFGLIDSSATTIQVDDVSGFAPKGGLIIDREAMTYSGKTATELTGVKRGLYGTTATTHVDDTRVSQNTCFISATGYVPSAASPESTKTISAYIPFLQEAWGSAKKVSDEIIVGYNGDEWSRYPTSSSLDNQHMRAVTANSYADAWIVGDKRTFFHWNGSNWSTGNVKKSGSNSSGKVPNKTVRAVDCLAKNDCWAVGDDNNSRLNIIRYNGSQWERYWDVPTKSKNLEGLDCSSSGYCWAVGDSKTFVYWDGSNWEEGDTDNSGSNKVESTTYYDVSCPSDTICWAVGMKEDSNPNIVKLDNNNGSTSLTDDTWRRVELDDDEPNINLYAIDCPTTSVCYAAGQKQGGIPYITKLSSGSWSRIPSSDFIDVENRDINGIECLSENFCLAVGDHDAHIVMINGIWYGGTNYNTDTSVEFNGIDIIGVGGTNYNTDTSVEFNGIDIIGVDGQELIFWTID